MRPIWSVMTVAIALAMLPVGQTANAAPFSPRLPAAATENSDLLPVYHRRGHRPRGQCHSDFRRHFHPRVGRGYHRHDRACRPREGRRYNYRRGAGCARFGNFWFCP